MPLPYEWEDLAGSPAVQEMVRLFNDPPRYLRWYYAWRWPYQGRHRR